jgi:hypothetical protein
MSSRCVPDAVTNQVTGTGGGTTTTTGQPIPRPTLNPIKPQAEVDPSLAANRQRYEAYQANLESGAGHSMDVLTGTQKDNLDAQVEQARSAAASQGIPFDEATFRAQAQKGINSAMAGEKLGREKMIGESYTQGLGVETAPASERNQRLGIDQQSQIATNDAQARMYGLDIGKYGIDVNAATSANNALLDFYRQLMGGMMNFATTNSTTFA